MNDRKLIALAAAAASIEPPKSLNDGCIGFGGEFIYYDDCEGKTWHSWNPLKSDRDAFQLMVALDLEVYQGVNCDRAAAFAGYFAGERQLFCIEYHHDHGGDKKAATRRAIVRAAAAIASNGGKS